MSHTKECKHWHIQLYSSVIGPNLICMDCEKILTKDDYNMIDELIRSCFNWFAEDE